MNRKLNVKLLLILLVGTVATVVTIHLVHEYQVGRNAKGLLKRAQQARADGDLFNAVKIQKRYLNYRRDDYEQLSNLALYMKEMTEQESGVSRRDLSETYQVIERCCCS